jgi:hypothetical protein
VNDERGPLRADQLGGRRHRATGALVGLVHPAFNGHCTSLEVADAGIQPVAHRIPSSAVQADAPAGRRRARPEARRRVEARESGRMARTEGRPTAAAAAPKRRGERASRFDRACADEVSDSSYARLSDLLERPTTIHTVIEPSLNPPTRGSIHWRWSTPRPPLSLLTRPRASHTGVARPQPSIAPARWLSGLVASHGAATATARTTTV